MTFWLNLASTLLLLLVKCTSFSYINGLQSISGSSSVTSSSRLRATEQGHSVGIDLGTTYSSIAILNKDTKTPYILKIDGSKLLPSVVSYKADDSILVGKDAKSLLATRPLSTFASTKRIIGQNVKEVPKDTMKLWRSRLANITDSKKASSRSSSGGASGRSSSDISSQTIQLQYLLESDTHTDCSTDGAIIKDGGGKTGVTNPEKVAAEILKKLLLHASETAFKGQPVTKAVITVPAYFNTEQREATIRAGQLAGLSKVKLLREPEAAAMAYGLLRSQRHQRTVLVVDLGGGTFDVSVMSVGNGVAEVIATNGDANLGGDDFDAEIVQWILQQIESSSCITIKDIVKQGALLPPQIRAMIIQSVKKDAVSLALLKHHAEIARKQLSSSETAVIDIPALYGNQYALTGLKLNRKTFNSLCKKLISRLVSPIREVALMANVNLVGESGIFDDGYEEASGTGQVNGDDDATTSTTTTTTDGYDSSGDYAGGNQGLSNSSMRSLKKNRKAAMLHAKERNKVDVEYNKEFQRVRKTIHNTRSSSSSSRDSSSTSSSNKLFRFPGGRRIDMVLFVGGGTRMPCVQEAVKSLTGLVHIPWKVDPEEAVCIGAGVMAGVLDGDIENMHVVSAWQTALLDAFGHLLTASSSRAASDDQKAENPV